MTRIVGRRAAIFLSGLVALACPAAAGAQTGLAPDVVAAIEAAFSDIDGSAPGCAVGVVQDQTLAYADGFGMANLDYAIPITPRSNFYLGSVGKQFTAAAVAAAARAGHLSLDDPIQRWVPEVPEYDRPITIRHLVHHTSGLRDYLALWMLSGRNLEDVHTNDETLALIARQLNPNFSPGDAYLYSNSGYFLLAVIVERATGMTLRAFAQRELLDPLGMTRTRFHDDRREVMEDRVVGYAGADGDYRLDHPWNFDKVGSGGLYSSIEDLVHWDRNYYTEEVGGAGFTEQMRDRGVLADGSSLSYAFGLVHGEYRGRATIGHGGALAGFRSELLRFPDERTTILVLCNFPDSEPGRRAREVADVVLGDRLDAVVATAEGPLGTPAPPAETPGDGRHHAALLGDYFSPELDATYRVYEADGRLMLEIPGGLRTPLVLADDAQLRAGSFVFELERQADIVTGFTIDAGRVRGIRFERRAD